MGFLGEVIFHLLVQLTTAYRIMVSKHLFIKDEQWAKWMQTACVVGPSVNVVTSKPFDKYLFILIIVKGLKRGKKECLLQLRLTQEKSERKQMSLEQYAQSMSHDK